ncbi:MAG: acyl-CoA dehydrogenase family protein, partial [Brachybacterium sp.]
MDFVIDDAMQGYIDAAAEVAAQIAPDYPQREKNQIIEPELRLLMGARGLIAPELPTALGGRSERALTTGMLTEQIARGDLTVAYVQVIGSLVGQILARTAR